MNFQRTLRFALLVAWFLGPFGGILSGPTSMPRAAHGADLVADDVMVQDPLLIPGPKRTKFSSHLKPLWLRALSRPDAETRRLAASTFAIAYQRGLRDLDDVVEPLRTVMQGDSDPAVRRAAAYALVVIGARDVAADLAAAADAEGLLFAQFIEPALAEWNYEPRREYWLKVLTAESTPRAVRNLACGALETVREPRAVPGLTEILKQPRNDTQWRLSAARALGRIQDNDLATLADSLSGSGRAPAMLDRLLAVQLLARQSDEATRGLLATFAVDPEPSIATPALVRLYALDPAAARPLAAASLTRSDAGLRAAAAPMIAAQEDAACVKLLSPLLDDHNPGVRRYVAARLAEFGTRGDLREVVIEQATAALAGNEWRALEQAALILGTIDHKPAAPRLLELLPHVRTEVAVSSAWAIRKLRLPELLPGLLEQMVATNANPQQHPLSSGVVTQVFQLFGELRYRPSEQLLRKYVPKSMTLAADSRMAAAWTLSKLLEDQPEDVDLARQMAERLADYNGQPPEVERVRWMMAVALGRMKARSQLDTLKRFEQMDGPYTIVGTACRWSVEQITGVKPPDVPPMDVGVSGWFLE